MVTVISVYKLQIFQNTRREGDVERPGTVSYEYV